MATNPRLRSMQQQIQQQGLTRDQAKGKYNLTDQDADWMNNNLGLRFAPAGARPAGLMAAGAPATMTTTADPGPVKAAMSRPRPVPTESSPAPAPTVAPVVATPPAAQAAADGYTAAAATGAPAVVAPDGGTAAQATGAAATGAPAVVAGAADATRARATGAEVVNQGRAATYRGAQGEAAGYNAAQGKAAGWKVRGRQTVQGQLANIVDSGSPLMEMAETRGLQEANKRGLMNSSMAVQSGQAALYDAAMPIATQDATTFANAGQFNAANRQDMAKFNVNERNDSRQFNAGSKQDMTLANMDSRNTANQFNASERNDRSQVNAQLGTQVNLSNADNSTQVSQFNAAQASDVSKFNVDKALQAGVVNQEQANAISKFNADLLTKVDLSNMASKNDFNKFLLDQQLQAGIINQQQYNEMAKFNATESNDAGQINATLAADIAKFNASESNALTKLGMDNDTRRDLANIEASYKTLMQTSASAGEIYKQYMGAVATILQSKDMDAVAKQEAINGLMGALNSSLDVVGGIGNIDIPDLEFQETATVGQAINGFPLPNAISGYGTINWNADFGDGDTSLRDMYNEYATENPDTALSPEDWYIKFRLKINDVTGGGGDTGNTGGGGGGGGDTGGSGTGSPGSGDSGP